MGRGAGEMSVLEAPVARRASMQIGGEEREVELRVPTRPENAEPIGDFDRHRFTRGDCWILALALRDHSDDCYLVKSELLDHAFCITPNARLPEDDRPTGRKHPEGTLLGQMDQWDAIDVSGRERLDKFLVRGTIQRELWFCDEGINRDPQVTARIREACARASAALEAVDETTPADTVEEILLVLSQDTQDLHLWDCDFTDPEELDEWGPEEDFEGSWDRAREIVWELAEPVNPWPVPTRS